MKNRIRPFGYCGRDFCESLYSAIYLQYRDTIVIKKHLLSYPYSLFRLWWLLICDEGGYFIGF